MTVLNAIILSVALCSLAYGYEYCKKEAKLCGGQTMVHIMCNKEQIEPESEYQKHYLMTDRLRDYFTYWHNYYRNLTASGTVPGKSGALPAAKQMRQLVWDYELEFLAHTHAGRCRQQHDKCRNTVRIPDGGQNLAHKQTKGKPPPTPVQRSEGACKQWFAESADTEVDHIRHYPSKSQLPPKIQIGHFTVLVNDNVGRLGCAVVFAKPYPSAPKQFNHTYVTCNYDATNIETYPSYQEGPPASNCDIYGSYGKSTNFSCLCAPTFKTKNTTALF